MNPIPRFPLLKHAIQELGLTTEESFRKLGEGVEITSEHEFVSAPHGFYDLLPTGHIVRVLIHLAHGDHTRCNPDPERWHRYHVAPCPASVQPSRRNRSFKTRRSDGRFTYFLRDLYDEEYLPEERQLGRPLLCCGHCRNKLRGLGLVIGEEESPDLKALLGGDLPRRMHPERFRHDGDRITGFLRDDWTAIVRFAKARAAGHCGRCGLKLAVASPFLHAHFTESAEPDGCLGKIRILCIGCHASLKRHETLRQTRDFLGFRRAHPDHPSLKPPQ